MKFIFNNKNELTFDIIEVDGCQIEGNQIRCDYAAIVKDTEYYIELKGQDIEHAIDQIIATINQLSDNPKEIKKKSFIISSKCPISSSRIQVIQKRFKKHFNSSFLVRNRKFTENI